MSSASPALRVAFRIVGPVALFFLAFAVLPLRGRNSWLGITLGALLLLGSVPLVVRRMQLVRASDRPVLEAVEAISLLLTMVIVGFSAIYFQLSDVDGQFLGMATRIDALYFTVITLSTVGFGDVVPTGQAARALVTAQIVVNLGFIGASVRVLTRAAQERRRTVTEVGRGGGTPPPESDG